MLENFIFNETSLTVPVVAIKFVSASVLIKTTTTPLDKSRVYMTEPVKCFVVQSTCRMCLYVARIRLNFFGFDRDLERFRTTDWREFSRVLWETHASLAVTISLMSSRLWTYLNVWITNGLIRDSFGCMMIGADCQLDPHSIRDRPRVAVYYYPWL